MATLPINMPTMQMGGRPDDYLPYLDQLNGSMTGMDQLIRSYEIAQPREMDMRAARNNTRQALFARGLDGPLAATVEADAANRVVDAFGRRRDETLQGLYGNRANLAMQIQQAEWQRRVLLHQQEMARRQAMADRDAGIFGLIGAGLGGVAGGIFGGPGGAMAGASLGGGLGSALGDFL